MNHPADWARIVRDWEAGFAVNDNHPAYPYDDEEGVSEFMRELHETVLRWLGLSLYAASVLIGMVVAFHVGRSVL